MKTAVGYLAGGAIAASCFMVTPAAAAILDVLTRSTPTESTNHEKIQLPLNDAGDMSLTYEPSGVPTEVFTFNAECVADGPAGSYVTINIVIDNHLTEPRSGKDSAFCSPTGTLVSASRITAYTFAGHHTHTIRVYATGVGTASWSLNSSLLMIQD